MLCPDDAIDCVHYYRTFLLEVQTIERLPSLSRESLYIVCGRRHVGLHCLSLLWRLRYLRFQASYLFVQRSNAFFQLLQGKHPGPVCRVVAAGLFLQLIGLFFYSRNVDEGPGHMGLPQDQPAERDVARGASNDPDLGLDD